MSRTQIYSECSLINNVANIMSVQVAAYIVIYYMLIGACKIVGDKITWLTDLFLFFLEIKLIFVKEMDNNYYQFALLYKQ